MKIQFCLFQEPIFNNQILHDMFSFRRHVFHDRLSWDVNSTNGIERDAFDNYDPYYMVARNDNDSIEGCWRILPTTGPYMLKDTFPQLLHGEPAPQSEYIWEVSRFAVLPESSNKHVQAVLGEVTMSMFQKIVHFAELKDISQLLSVNSIAFERMLRRAGIPIRRFGGHKPIRIGKVMTVACWIDINEQLKDTLFNHRHFDKAA